MHKHASTALLCVICLVGGLLVQPLSASGSQLAPAGGTILRVPYDCTLRQAVQAANLDQAAGRCPAGNGVDTIRLAEGVHEVTLSEPGHRRGRLHLFGDRPARRDPPAGRSLRHRRV